MAFAGSLLVLQTGLPVYAAEADNQIGDPSGTVETMEGGIQITAPDIELESVDVEGVPYYDIYYGADDNMDIVSEGLALAVESGDSAMVFVAYDVASGSDITQHYLQTTADSNIFALEYEMESEELNGMVFTIEDISDTDFIELTTAVQNQEAYAIYYTTSGDAEYMETKLLDMDESSLLTVSEMPDSAVYPVMILDSDSMDMVAVAFSKDEILALGTEQEDFYANSSGSSSSSGSSGSSSSGDSDSSTSGGTSDSGTTTATNTDTTTTDTGTTDTVTTGAKGNSSYFWETLLGKAVSGAVIGGIAGLIGMVVRKIKKRKEPAGSDIGGGDMVEYFGSETASADNGDNGYYEYSGYQADSGENGYDSGASQEFNGGSSQPVSIKIYGIGGYMDGRVYEVDGREITFGRDVSNTVIFPADMSGISRQHCTVFFKDGMLMLMDRGSTYGTFLEGYGKLTPHQPKALQIGVPFYLADKNNCFVIK